MNLLDWLVNGTIPVPGGELGAREVIGNLFGLASAILGMKRLLWAWPIGLVGNVLLFTVFATGELSGQIDEPLWGQAGRQVFFFAVSIYGWVRWAQFRRRSGGAEGGVGVIPRWAGRSGRLQLLGAAVVLWVAFYFILKALSSWGPVSDAWILTGSILATYGMARGWVEFWLIWIAVDIVGVPLLLVAGYYPSAIMYIVYGAFCVVGFVSWLRLERRGRDGEQVAAADPVIETVG
jgi:nicotinamide mononucleotide transporter